MGVRTCCATLITEGSSPVKSAPVVKTDVKTESEAEPTLNFSRIIRLSPSAGTFAGWGPKMTGYAIDALRRLN